MQVHFQNSQIKQLELRLQDFQKPLKVLEWSFREPFRNSWTWGVPILEDDQEHHWKRRRKDRQDRNRYKVNFRRDDEIRSQRQFPSAYPQKSILARGGLITDMVCTRAHRRQTVARQEYQNLGWEQFKVIPSEHRHKPLIGRPGTSLRIPMEALELPLYYKRRWLHW